MMTIKTGDELLMKIRRAKELADQLSHLLDAIETAEVMEEDYPAGTETAFHAMEDACEHLEASMEWLS